MADGVGVGTRDVAGGAIIWASVSCKSRTRRGIEPLASRGSNVQSFSRRASRAGLPAADLRPQVVGGPSLHLYQRATDDNQIAYYPLLPP